MKKIGIISDTHGTFDDTLREFLKDVDEIWHAGDIGSLELADAIAYSYSKGEKVIIPAFAVERTQEILYCLHVLQSKGKLPADMPVFVDSPLAIRATEVFRRNRELFDEDAQAAWDRDRRSSAERGVWDQNVEAEGEHFDVMEEIARRVPLSKIARPAWDLQQLASLGMKAEADETVWKRVWSEEETISFASTPMFLVRGRK